MTDATPTPDGPTQDTTPGALAPQEGVQPQDTGQPDDQPDDQNPDDDQDDSGDTGSRERNYRKRAQTAEAERDQLRQQLDALRGQIIGKYASARGIRENSLLTNAGYAIENFITDKGEIDEEKLSAACADVIKRYNIAQSPRRPQPNAQQGTGSPQQHGKMSWADALKGG